MITCPTPGCGAVLRAIPGLQSDGEPAVHRYLGREYVECPKCHQAISWPPPGGSMLRRLLFRAPRSRPAKLLNDRCQRHCCIPSRVIPGQRRGANYLRPPEADVRPQFLGVDLLRLHVLVRGAL
jgi:hypothetical protein